MAGLSGEWSARRDGPLPVPVVVPSIQFSDHLQLRIAEEQGVCMGFDFLTPQGFIARAAGLGNNSWSKERLCWRILPHVAGYAADLGVRDPSPRDRFALAGLLADRFDQYGHFRPEIIRKWARAETALKGAASADEKTSEAWQRGLWKKLQDETPDPHPALELERLKREVNFQDRLRSAFPRLLVIGTGSIDPLLVEVLGMLSEAGADVSIHVVLPSLDFLGDLRRRNALPAQESDPESILLPSGNPLLESMGRHAVGSFLLLVKLDDQYTHWPEQGEPQDSSGSLLERLQGDIRALREPVPAKADGGDTSLRVHSCFGPRREMEALRDEILRAFEDLKDLKPEEIHIVAPSLETYAPLVSAVLEQGGMRLPVRMTELPAAGHDPVIEGALALLEMARNGRFEASRIMELLHLRAAQQALGIADDEKSLERVRGWVRESGLTQGLEGDEPGSWGFSRDRLIAARWLGGDDALKYPDGTFVLPVGNQLGGDGELMDRFVSWHSSLASTLREWSVEGTASEWGERLSLAGETLLAGDDDAGLAIRPHLAFLKDLKCPEPVDAGTIFDWLQAGSQESGPRPKVSGRITLGRFKQLQNIPCRVLAMVGMHEGQFPGQNRVPAWDLLQSDPRAWDRNPRVDDRQLFLDAVLVPSDRLIITASTRNVRTKKCEPFSSCVDELLRVAGRMGRPREGLVVEHRLQPFEAGYFSKGETLPRSFDSNSARVALSLRDGTTKDGVPFWNGEDAPQEGQAEPVEISIPQLCAFWRDPATAFLKAQGIALPFEKNADDEELDWAPLSLGPLQSWQIKSSVVEEVVFGSADLSKTEAVLRANRGLPPGKLGARAWKSNLDLSKPLGDGVKANLGETKAVDVVLDAPKVRVTGRVLTGKSGDALFAYRAGLMKKAKHFLEAWIQAVVAACSGSSLPTHLLDESSPDVVRELPAIPVEQAKTILRDLVAGFLEGQSRPLCFATATSSELARLLAKGGEEPVASAAAKEWEQSQYGSAEGCKPATLAAWRDRDAFEDPAPWVRWAEAVAAPLRKWGGF